MLIRDVSLVLLFYNSPLMLKHQLDTIADYPEDVLRALHVIVVDDGSPDHPAVDVVQPHRAYTLRNRLWNDARLDLRLFRTSIDIPWNEEFATNLGISQVETQWFMHTDLDHEVPAKTLVRLMSDDYDTRCAYLFSRNEVTREGLVQPRAPHPASWFMTTKLFWEIGGYDERFRGRYMPSDRDFRERVSAMRVRTEVLTSYLYVHSDIPDASASCSMPHGVDEEGESIYDRIKAERGDRRPLTLQSPWGQVL